MRNRLRAWLWLTPAIWLAIVAWGYLYFDPMAVAPQWASNVLALAIPIQAAAALATLVYTTRRSTRLYVIPFVVFVCVGSAYAWLHVWTALKHSWF